MILGLHHVGRAVTDLPAMAEELGVITGWPVSAHGPDDPFLAGRAATGSAWAHGPNGWIEYVGVDGPASARRGINEAGVTHAAVQTPRIEDVVARLDAAGIDRHADPVALGTGFLYLYVRDGEELVTEVEGAPHAPADAGAWLAHGAIATADIDRLRAAYQALTGADRAHTTRVGNRAVVDELTALSDVDVTGTWVPTPTVPVEIWQYHHPPTGPTPRVEFETPGSGHLAFETDDLDADLGRVAEAGFEVRDDPVGTGGVQVARLVDPDGNWVELVAFDDAGDERSLRQRPDVRRAETMNALLHGTDRGSSSPARATAAG